MINVMLQKFKLGIWTMQIGRVVHISTITQSSRNDYLIIPHLSFEELPVFPPESSRDTDLKRKIGIHVAYVSNIGINCAHF
jgi:hypothetical protein